MEISSYKIDNKKIVDFHFKSLQGMYFSEYIPRDGYVLLFSDLVEDSYYNYIAQTTIDLKKILKEASPMFEKRKRNLAIYVTPCSNIYGNESMIPEKFELWATDAWMILDDLNKITSHKIPKNIAIEQVNYEDRDEYVNIFNLSYGGDNPEDPYANLPEFYGQSLRRSFDSQSNEFKKQYVWAKLNNKVVGIASMLYNDNIAGIYGVGTIEKYRKCGVGTSLTKFLINQAIDRKVATIMLQTESGSKVEQWYVHMGFKTIFLGKYYTTE